AVLDGLGDGEDHPAILERAGRVLALDLGVEIPQAEAGAEPAERDERRLTLAQADDRRGVRDRQERAIALDEGLARRPTGSCQIGAHRAALSAAPRALTGAPLAGGNPAHVDPRPRAIAIRSPRTALDV